MYARLKLGSIFLISTVTALTLGAFALSASNAQAEPEERGTRTTIGCSGPVLPDQHFSCAVRVSNTLGEKQVTGSVNLIVIKGSGSFEPSPCPLTPSTNKSAVCTAVFRPTVVGPLELAASYGGDSGHDPSVGNTSILSAAITKTEINCVPSSVVDEHPTSCAVRVFSGPPNDPGRALGSISFSISGGGGTPIPACTLRAGGSAESFCEVTYTPTGPGQRTISANYPANPNHLSSQSSTTIGVIPKHLTSTAVTCVPSPVHRGDTSGCTITVEDKDPSPSPLTGTVEIESKGLGEFVGDRTCSPPQGSVKFSCLFTYRATQLNSGLPVQINGLFKGDPDHSSSSGVQELEVFAAPTETKVECGPMRLPVDSISTCTATVGETGDEIHGKPAGLVVFSSSSPSFSFPAGSACELAGPGPKVSCSVNYKPEAIGTDTVTGFYPGDGLHEPSHDELLLQVTKRRTKTTLVCEPASVEANSPSHCTATVKDLSGAAATTPTGKLTFQHDDSGIFSAADCELIGSGDTAACSIDYTPEAASPLPQVLTTSFPGNVEQEASSGDFGLQVNRHTTKTTLHCEPDTVETHNSSHCTATVKDLSSLNATHPTGKVSFQSDSPGSFTRAECELSGSGNTSSCSVDYTPAEVASGTHLLKASYPGDLTHAASNGSFELHLREPNRHATETTLLCTPPAVTLGNSVNCTVTVADHAEEDGTPPRGLVSFSASGTFTGAPCELRAGRGPISSCSVTYRAERAGEPEIQATYPGDLSHVGSRGHTSVRVLAEKQTTATTVACVPSSPGVGKATTCTATVEDIPAASLFPGGLVEFKTPGETSFSENGECRLSATVPGQAKCSVLYTPQAAGSHLITASYQGDELDRSSTGTTTVETAAAVNNDTETKLSCAETDLTTGATTHCSAEVIDKANLNPASAPSGEVSFTDPAEGNSFNPTTCELEATGTGKAACKVEVAFHPTAAGNRELQAHYGGGDGAHNVSTGKLEVHVTEPAVKHQTTTSLTCNPASVTLGGAGACTVMVKDEAGAATATPPSGDVHFSSDGPGTFSETPPDCTLFRISPDSARCQIIYTPTSLANDPTHTIEAAYPGDNGHESSTDTAAIAVSAPGNNVHQSTTALSCAPPSVTLGGISACTVTVKDTAAANRTAPGGAVIFASDSPGEFSEGGCQLTAIAAGESRCQLLYKPLEVGNQTITALYPGQPGAAGHLPSEGSAQVAVNAQAPGAHDTATALGCQPASPTFGSPITCTATVTDTEAPVATPEGAVIFASNGAGAFATGGCHLTQLQAGEASCQITYTPAGVGPQTISASYEGEAPHDANPGHNPSPVATTQVTAAAHATQASLSCAPATLPIGTAANCMVTVADASQVNAASPTGTVKFQSDGPGALASGGACALAGAGTGKATCQIAYTPSAPGSGTHTIAAAYQGDAAHRPSQASAKLVVSAPTIPVAAPNTTIAKKPRRKTAAHVAKFTFSSDQPGSSFQCKLDKKAFKPCGSPFKAKKLKPGHHVFQVKAINPQGLADPTPAVFKWTVGKVGKKH
jgi:hypothetical protein